MFKDRIHDTEGGELGEGVYVSRIQPEEVIWFAGTRKGKVVAVVDTHGEGEYEGLLMVEPAA